MVRRREVKSLLEVVLYLAHLDATGGGLTAQQEEGDGDHERGLRDLEWGLDVTMGSLGHIVVLVVVDQHLVVLDRCVIVLFFMPPNWDDVDEEGDVGDESDFEFDSASVVQHELFILICIQHVGAATGAQPSE